MVAAEPVGWVGEVARLEGSIGYEPGEASPHPAKEPISDPQGVDPSADAAHVEEAGLLIERLNAAIDAVNELGDEHHEWSMATASHLGVLHCCVVVLEAELRPRIPLLAAVCDAQDAINVAQANLSEAEAALGRSRADPEAGQGEGSPSGLWETRVQLPSRFAVSLSGTVTAARTVEPAKRALRSATTREEKARKAVDRAISSAGLAPETREDEVSVYRQMLRRRGELETGKLRRSQEHAEWEQRKQEAAEEVTNAMAALEALSEEIHNEREPSDATAGEGDEQQVGGRRAPAVSMSLSDEANTSTGKSSDGEDSDFVFEGESTHDARGIFGRRRARRFSEGGSAFVSPLTRFCATSADVNSAGGAPAPPMTASTNSESLQRSERLRDEVFEAGIAAMSRLLRRDNWEKRRPSQSRSGSRSVASSFKYGGGGSAAAGAGAGAGAVVLQSAWADGEECVDDVQTDVPATPAQSASAADASHSGGADSRQAGSAGSSGGLSADTAPMVLRRMARLFQRSSESSKPSLQGGGRGVCDGMALLDWEACMSETLHSALPELQFDSLEEEYLAYMDPDCPIETQHI